MAAPVALAFRIAADLSAMRANLKEALDQVETTTASMKKMANSLDGSKLISDAGAMVKAVNDLGGAAKLTQAEQARVNTTLTEAIAKYDALGKSAPQSMRDLAAATQQVGGASKFVGDLADQVKATALGFISAQAVIGGVERAFDTLTEFIGDSVKAYANAELAAKKMTVALQAQGTATPANVAAFKGLGEEFQRTTVYSNDLVVGMEALLTQVGNVAPSQMQKALTAATDLASGLGIDLQTATLLVGKAFEGHIETLARYGVVVDQAKFKAEGITAVLDAINEKFGGQAQAELETYSGKLKQIANDWDDVKKAIGASIVMDPQVVQLLDTLLSVMHGLNVEGQKRTLSDWFAQFFDQSGVLSVVVAWMNNAKDAMADLASEINNLHPQAPKTGVDTSFFSNLDAQSKAFAQTVEDGWKKDAEAAKKYQDAVDAAFKKWSGQDVAEQMKILNTVFNQLADSGKITEQQLEAMAKEAVKLWEQGGQLSPRMKDVAMQLGLIGPAAKLGADGIADLGFKIQLAIPQVSAFEQAVQDLQKKTKDGMDGLSDIGFKVGSGFAEGAKQIEDHAKQIKKAIDDAKKSADDFAQAFEILAQIVGSSSSAAAQAIAALATAIANGVKAGADMKATMADPELTGGEKFAAATKDIMGMVAALNAATDAGTKTQRALSGAAEGAAIGTSIMPGYGTAVGAGVGALVGVIRGALSTSGRQAVEAFAAEFGGFEDLQKKMMAELGPMWETYWINLTQRVDRGNVQEAQAAIAQIQAAFAASPAGLTQAAGYQTRADLQAVADKAKEVYDFMVSSGNYTASEIADAFKKMQDATLAAMDDTQKATYDAAVSARDNAQKVLDALDGQIKSLQDSIAQEAPEAVMGAVEAQQRAQLAALEAQRATAQANLDDANSQINDAAQAAVDAAAKAAMQAGSQTVDAIRDALDKSSFHVKVTVDGLPGGSTDGFAPGEYNPNSGGGVPRYGGPQAAGGDYWVTRKTVFIAGEAGPERVTFSGANRSAYPGSGGRTALPVTIELNGRSLWSGLLDVAHAEGMA